MSFKKLGLISLALLLGMSTVVSCGGEGGTSVKKTTVRKKHKKGSNKFTIAERESATTVLFALKYKNSKLSTNDLILFERSSKTPVKIQALKLLKKGRRVELVTDPLDLFRNYTAGLISMDERAGKLKTNFVDLQFGDAVFKNIYSDKPLGHNIEKGKNIFRVFAPRANLVTLCLFDKAYSSDKPAAKYPGEKQIKMTRDKDGVWEVSVKGDLSFKLYGYRVAGPEGLGEMFNPNIIVADPYSKAVATKEVAPQHQLSVIVDTGLYTWQSKKKYIGLKQEDYIVYEMHVRDMTMLSKSTVKKGTYEGLVEDGKEGGIGYIQKLGVNAVELLPTQEFDEVELPYKDKSVTPVNSWNTYGRNHWGYMTSQFFAPEAFYLNGKIKAGKWIGVDGTQVFAFKRMVDLFHKKGIAVVMDVVYNHVSQYDRNALKYIDKKYYFWMSAHGTDDAHSGCGNDFKTDRPMASRLIVDSTRYWVNEYHVDGFRFDLGTLIDWNTYGKIEKAVYKFNPNTYLVAEPWMGGRGEPRDGGGYSPDGMARHGIAAWNDKYRELNKSLALGRASVSEMKKAVKAYPGVLREPKYSVNYVESHDNNTLADYLRLNTKKFKSHTRIDMDKYVKTCKLDDDLLAMMKISALSLMTVQGPVMMHEGMELGRMKVVVPPSGDSVFPPNSADWEYEEITGRSGKKVKTWINKKKTFKGKPQKWSSKAAPYLIDRDSYEKDNECNWINWDLMKVNGDLFKYYQGLIAIRKQYKAFGMMPIKKITFIDGKNSKGKKMSKNALGYVYDKAFSGDDKSFVVLVNGEVKKTASFALPKGDWKVIVNGQVANVEGKTLSGTIEVPARTGMILYQ